MELFSIPVNLENLTSNISLLKGFNNGKNDCGRIQGSFYRGAEKNAGR